MKKLLSANFHAMLHAKMFWAGNIIMAATALYVLYDMYNSRVRFDSNATLDSSALSFTIILFLLLPVLGGMFINTDYHDGAIRNKLTVGHTRRSVYLANLFTVFVTGLFYGAFYLLFYSLVGIPFFGVYQEPAMIAQTLLLFILVFFSLSALVTLIATLIAHRAVLVLCALVAIGMMAAAQIVNEMLASPRETLDDYTSAATVTDNGQVKVEYFDLEGNHISLEDIPVVPNPSYVQEPMRTVLRTVNNMQPGGQLVELIQEGHREPAAEDPQPDGAIMRSHDIVRTPYWQLAVYALALTALSTGLGLTLFARKDLK